MSVGSDVFGYIAGASGIAALLYSILLYQLPRTKIEKLEKLIRDTEDIFIHAKDEGWLTDSRYIFKVEDRLFDFNSKFEDLRTRTLCATSFRKECVEMVNGLSRKITVICTNVSKLRADVLTTSQAERLRHTLSSQLRRATRFRSSPSNHRTSNSFHQPFQETVTSSRYSQGPPKSCRGGRRRSQSCPPGRFDDYPFRPPPFLEELSEGSSTVASNRICNTESACTEAVQDPGVDSKQYQKATLTLYLCRKFKACRQLCRTSGSEGEEMSEARLPVTYGPPARPIIFTPTLDLPVSSSTKPVDCIYGSDSDIMV